MIDGSGRLFPFSHLEIALSVIPSLSAKTAWVNPFSFLQAAIVNVNYIFKKIRNLMFRKNGIIFFRNFNESLESCSYNLQISKLFKLRYNMFRFINKYSLLSKLESVFNKLVSIKYLYINW